MEFDKLVKHHTQIIKDQNQNKWEVIEVSDLEEICKTYHQEKLKENMVEVISCETCKANRSSIVGCRGCENYSNYQR